MPQSDFLRFLGEMGLSQRQMDAAAARFPRPLPREPGEQYEIRRSPIHGNGCFATAAMDGLIGKLRTGDQWHEAGRYINHSASPNARAVMEKRVLVAYGVVPEGAEVTLDYRQVRDLLEVSHG